MKKTIIILCVIYIAFGIHNQFFNHNHTNDQIVNAIYLAEGGDQATYLYGIRSVSYDTPAEARRICYNTVRNNRERYADYGNIKHRTFLEFLASRYCPVGADNDPRGLNKHWLKNVKYFLNKNKGEE